MLEIKRLFFIYNDTRQKIIKSQVNKLAFFSCCPLPHLSHNQPFRLGGGDAHGRGGMHRGGEGGCTCILCIPLGTPLSDTNPIYGIHLVGTWDKIPYVCIPAYLRVHAHMLFRDRYTKEVKSPRGRFQGPYCGGWGSRIQKSVSI
jgi:hypothetical protein